MRKKIHKRAIFALFLWLIIMMASWHWSFPQEKSFSDLTNSMFGTFIDCIFSLPLFLTLLFSGKIFRRFYKNSKISSTELLTLLTYVSCLFASIINPVGYFGVRTLASLGSFGLAHTLWRSRKKRNKVSSLIFLCFCNALIIPFLLWHNGISWSHFND